MQVQHLALVLIEPHYAHADLLFKPVQVPLFYCVSCTTQLGVINNLAEGALNPIIIDKGVKEHWSQNEILGDVTCDRPPPRHRATDHNPLAVTTQLTLHPPNSLPFKLICLQFRDKDVVWESTYSFECLYLSECIDAFFCQSPQY